MSDAARFAPLVRASLVAICSDELADALLTEFQELNQRYYVADFRPSELSGARFSEAAIRICQNVITPPYTALGKTLPGLDKLLPALEAPPSSPQRDPFRIHIPRAVRLIYDFRSKRDVAHLGKGVSPNAADASLVLGTASWILAEMVRIGHKCDIATAQAMVDGLVERRSPLLWHEGDVVRVLDPGLKYPHQVLLVLHHFDPDRVDEKKLFEWVEYSSMSDFRSKVLRPLHDRALIDYRKAAAVILPPGNKLIERVLRERREKGT
jgi:hypothetical protein